MRPENTTPEPAPEPADETSRPFRLTPVQLPADRDDEPMGGDPPCWAHLFDDEDDPPR
jgi:hypothetical protein